MQRMFLSLFVSLPYLVFAWLEVELERAVKVAYTKLAGFCRLVEQSIGRPPLWPSNERRIQCVLYCQTLKELGNAHRRSPFYLVVYFLFLRSRKYWSYLPAYKVHPMCFLDYATWRLPRDENCVQKLYVTISKREKLKLQIRKMRQCCPSKDNGLPREWEGNRA